MTDPVPPMDPAAPGHPWSNPWLSQPGGEDYGRFLRFPNVPPCAGAVCRLCRRELIVVATKDSTYVVCNGCDGKNW